MAFMDKRSEPTGAPSSKPMMSDQKPHGVWCSTCWGMGDFGKKILMTLVGVLLVYLIFFVGTLMRNNIKKFETIGQMDVSERMITVTGYGKVSGKNDIAVTSIGYTNTDKDVKKAQDANTKVMSQVLAELTAMGIEDKDLQSSYSIYPNYDYNNLTASGEYKSTIRDYSVSQSVSVKIRDLSKVPNVLALAGKYGANDISSLKFTVDDTEVLREQARQKALADVRVKAEKLARSLGVALVEVTSYYESPDYGYGYAAYDSLSAASSYTPTTAGGSQDIAMNVNVTYKVVSR